MSTILEPYIPRPDARGRHTTFVHAPADLVLEVARNFDIQSIPAVHTIFWLRSEVLRAEGSPPARGVGLVASTRSLGWGVLVEHPGRAYPSGAACRPWEADVVFSAIPPEHFADYAEPERVKIAWSLDVEPIGPALTRLSAETRVVATDECARATSRRYWRVFGIGIVMVRWLALPAVRRAAARRWLEIRTSEQV